MLRTTLLRAARTTAPRTIVPARSASGSYAVSNTELVDIEKRWEGLPPAEQAELWMSLRDRMKGSWTELTAAEKKACMFLLPPPPRVLC